VALAYVFGFFVMLAILGWKPDVPHKKQVEAPAPQAVADVRALPAPSGLGR
jgi:hypothetical protein